MELVEGETIVEHCRSRGLSIRARIELFLSVLGAVRYAHERAIVHRDLKPANIYMLAGGGLKLLDFGFAKLRGYTADAAQNVVGTPSFMSPEAALGLTKKIDAQSDVWSLGATLFQVLSGQSVHNAAHVEAMMLASASSRPRSLGDAAPELPTGRQSTAVARARQLLLQRQRPPCFVHWRSTAIGCASAARQSSMGLSDR